MQRIKKVKTTKEGKITIEYEVQDKRGEWNEYMMSSKEAPKPSFGLALNDLIPHTLKMCELPHECQKDIIVTGVSLSYGGEKEVMGATIIAVKLLKNSNCNLNLITPHKAEEAYSEGGSDPNQLLDGDCSTAIHALLAEAMDYVKGVRAQTDIFAKAA